MTDLPVLTLQELIERVRAQALQEPSTDASDGPITQAVGSGPAKSSAPTAAPPPEPPAAAPAILPPLDGWEQSGLRWDEALLAAPEGEWLDLAYRVLLGRPSDPAGVAHYQAEQARHGSRYWVMFAMRGSPEGLAVGRSLAGLRLPRLLLLAGRIGMKVGLGRLALTPLRRLERRIQRPLRALAWLRHAQEAQHRQLAELRHQDLLTMHRLDLALHSHTIALQSDAARLDSYFQILLRHSTDLNFLKGTLAPFTEQAEFFDRRVIALAEDLGRVKRRHQRMIEALQEAAGAKGPTP